MAGPPAWYHVAWHRRVTMETKQQILKAIEELPDDAGIEEALDRLYLLYKIERGLRQADQGALLTQEGVRERVSKWAKYGGRRRRLTDQNDSERLKLTNALDWRRF